VKFGNYAPPASPSHDQQRDALQKGLGRASQWASNGRLDDESLLAACLLDQRFDTQVEESRGDWLWHMMQVVGATERFRVPILHALFELSDERSAPQLCTLARHYAETGDDTFRSRLYEMVERKPFAAIPWLGQEEIVALDGEEAFLFAAKVHGRSLAEREWEWDDGSLMDLALDRLGVRHVSRLLGASSDGAVSRYREGWRRDVRARAEQRQQISHREKMAAIPVEEIIRAAHAENKCYWFRGWGRQATEADLKTVLACLWDEQDQRFITNLLMVFSARALPEFDPRLIELSAW
jgi:hypothetical protein